MAGEHHRIQIPRLKLGTQGLEALKQLPREKVQLATKFGIIKSDLTGVVINGTPEYVRSAIEASLKRLDVDYIDLYYQHRVDPNTPIEDTMSELKKLVEEGKIKRSGRSGLVISEEQIVPLCRELGIGIVPYSPLGRGFFGGKGVVETLPANSFLPNLPRFQGENLDKNKTLYMKIEMLAKKHGCTPAQLALAWVLHQGADVAPIPGTTQIKNLDSNIGSLKVKLTEEDLKEVSDAVSIKEVAGDVMPDVLSQLHWKFGNTPPKGSKVST
ncbi:hypothetical protein V6N12_011378 [Hibiscus sabdariffa]|uniref:NADP-dependent oxidoreductase domain-containing protein n=1 Tax=Hibiscus sabdariffa TaxID=183260 RepID=A0ABR2ABK0_9ROSI